MEGALTILEKSNEYVKYKEKNSDVFAKYRANMTHDGIYGWGWKIVYTNHINKEGRKSISFAINLEKNEVMVLEKNSIVE